MLPEFEDRWPGTRWQRDLGEEFLCEMEKRGVALDFFSWHIYCTEPIWMVERAQRIRTLLDRYHYNNTESILNEWNYVKGWREEFVYTIKAIHGMKGAAFVASCICACRS